MQSIKRKKEGAFLERILILTGSLVYLLIFRQILPHGDALRIVRQIESSDLVWNPNHLIFDPIGYGFYRILSRYVTDVTVLGSFEIISVLTTLVSLMIFFEILLLLGVRRPIRIIFVVGLFSSASFLGLAGSQYYFMVQMPFLLGALYLYIDFILKFRGGQSANANLYGMGILLALASALMFNNLLVVIGAGVSVGFVHISLRKFKLKNSLRLFFAAAITGFPVFIWGHSLSKSDSNLFVWLLSYQGDPGSALNKFYGIKWTVTGILEGIARVVFNFVFGNMVEHAGLGTVLRVFLFGETVEFIPQWNKIILGLIAIPATMIVMIWVLYFMCRRISTEPVIRFFAIWLFVFLLFNFLWDTEDPTFWFQTIPGIWFLLLLSLEGISEPILITSKKNLPNLLENYKWKMLSLFVAMLFIVNTMNLILPSTDREYYQKQSRHARILREGDLEIIPGWDQQKWLTLSKEAPKVRQLVLMNMALSGSNSADEKRRLPELVEYHLRTGGRVIVARVFDLDEDIMPWYGLQRAGWSRYEIQKLLEPFCNRKIDQIESIVFRELYMCEEGKKHLNRKNI